VGSSAHLATQLDVEMLSTLGITIAASSTPDSSLQVWNGPDFAKEVPRLLVRYLRKGQVGRLTGGSDRPQWVTLTPYAPDDLISWLALPAPLDPPSHCLLLDAAQLDPRPILGPRWVRLGGGIEFLLPGGFPPQAVVPLGWEIEIR